MRVLPAFLVVAALAPAAHAADHPLVWPTCCSTGTPEQTAVAVDDTVTFSTADFASHPLVWDDGDFTTTETGSSRQFAFPKAGTFAFHCRFHGNMVGRVKVGDDQHAAPDFSFAPAAPKAGEPVTFTYIGSADPDGAIVSYRWDLDGNGTYEKTTPSGSVTHTYAAAGTFAAKVVVVDDGHESSAPGTKNVVVAAQDAPPVDEPAGPAPSPEPGTGGQPPAAQPTADTAAPLATRVRVRGGRLRFTLAEPASLTGVLRRGTRRVRGLRASLTAGSATVRLPSGLKPGRYRLRFVLTDASGNRSRPTTLRFRVPTSAASAARRRAAPPRR